MTLKKDDIHFLFFFYLPLGPCQIVRLGGGGGWGKEEISEREYRGSAIGEDI